MVFCGLLVFGQGLTSFATDGGVVSPEGGVEVCDTGTDALGVVGVVVEVDAVAVAVGQHGLAVVLDAFSRRVVGWSMANHLRTQLVLDALDMALWQRRPDGVIHHSDSEYLRAGSLGVT